MRPIIEFCTNNLHHGTERLLRKLEQDDRYDVVEYGCLGNCGECYVLPFALVNGEIVAAEAGPGLEEAIEVKIKEIEAMLDLLED